MEPPAGPGLGDAAPRGPECLYRHRGRRRLRRGEAPPSPGAAAEERSAAAAPAHAAEPGRSLFYPRIIREFDDGPDEEPMVYTRR